MTEVLDVAAEELLRLTKLEKQIADLLRETTEAIDFASSFRDGRCNQPVNGGRHICRYTRGHAGPCHPHINASPSSLTPI